jgi:branched-chain amino acid transport system permease protein
VIGLVITRMQPDAMGISTFALLVIVYTVFQNWEPVTRGGKGIYDVPGVMTPISGMVGLMVIMGVALLFKASPPGLRLQGVRDDPLAAQSLGIDPERARLVGWVLSAALMAAGGAMWAHNVTAFGHHSFFFRDTFAIIAMLIIGGQASVTGAIVGCAVISVVSEVMRYPERGMAIGSIQIPELYGAVQLTIAILILVALILRPSGMLGTRELMFPIWQRIRNLNKRTRS